MRRKLAKSSSVPKAIEILKRIKIGELEMGGRKKRLLTNPTEEQADLLKALGVTPLSNALPKKGL